MTAQNNFLSHRQLVLAGKWEPDEPFADLIGLSMTVPLSVGMYEAAMTTRRKPRANADAGSFINVKRLAYRVIYVNNEPQAVIPLSAGAEWLAAVTPNLPNGMGHGLMLTACWRTACRVVRGSRNRTSMAKRAFKAFAAAFPDDPRVLRQPLARAAA